MIQSPLGVQSDFGLDHFSTIPTFQYDHTTDTQHKQHTQHTQHTEIIDWIWTRMSECPALSNKKRKFVSYLKNENTSLASIRNSSPLAFSYRQNGWNLSACLPDHPVWCTLGSE